MLVSLICVGLWISATARFLLSPKAGIFWILMFFAFTPRALGFGVGDGFALSGRRMILLSLAGMLLLLLLRGRIPLRAHVPAYVAPVFGAFVIIFASYIVSSLIFTGGFFFVLPLVEDFMVLTVAFMAAFVASHVKHGDRNLVIFAFVIPVFFTLLTTIYEMRAQEFFINFLTGGDRNGIKTLGARSNFDGSLYVRDGRFRVAGLLGGPLPLAEYLCYAATSFVYLFFRKYINLPVLMVLLGVTVFCLFNTGSRGALFVFCVTMPMLALAYVRFHRVSVKLLFVGITITVLLAIVLMIAYNIATLEQVEFLYLVDREQRSLISRFSQYEKAFTLILNSPLVGFGIYRHPVFDLGGGLTTLDNHYLGVLLRGGFIGLGAFIFMLFYIYRIGMRFGFSLPQAGLQPLAFWLMSTLMAFILMKIVLYHNYNHVFFYTIVFYALIQMSRAERALSGVEYPHLAQQRFA
jgi:O-antigen ligase